MKKPGSLVYLYLRLVFIFSVFFIPLVFIQRSEDAYYLPKYIILMGGLQLLGPVLLNLKTIKFDNTDRVMGLFMVFYVIGIFRSPDIYTGVFKYLEWPACAGFYFFGRYFLGAREVKKVILAALASAFLASAYAGLQVLNIDLAGWITNFGGRAFSSFGNPDFFGGFLVLIIPLSAIVYYYGKKKLSYCLMLFFILILILSQTRSSIAAMAVSLALMIFLFPGYFKQGAKFFIPGILLIALLIGLSGKASHLAERIKSFSDIKNADLQGRVQMWAAGARMIKKHPVLGSGIYSVKTKFHGFYKGGGKYFETDRLHNDYIEVAAESGAGAGILFIITIALLFYGLLRKGDTGAKIAAASIAGLCAHAFLNFPFYIIPTKLYFFLIAGLGLNAVKKIPVTGVTVPAVYGVSAGALIILFTVNLTGSIYLNYAINSLNGKNYNEAEKFLEKSRVFYRGEEVYYYTGRLFYETQKHEWAERSLNKYLEYMPMSKRARILLSIIYAEKGEYKKAIGYLDGFLSKYPGDNDVLNNKGKMLYLSGDAKGAMEIYRQVLKNDPYNRTAEYNFKAIYINKGRRE